MRFEIFDVIDLMLLNIMNPIVQFLKFVLLFIMKYEKKLGSTQIETNDRQIKRGKKT
jgi:p-aminobenzoyl-glutamate transporter AbgT